MENEMLLDLGIPDELMRLVPTPNGYDLVIFHSEAYAPIHIAAIRRIEGVDDTKLFHMAQVMACSFVFAHRISEVIDNLQPEGWSDTANVDEDAQEESRFWRSIMRIWMQAINQPVPVFYQEPPVPPPGA